MEISKIIAKNDKASAFIEDPNLNINNIFGCKNLMIILARFNVNIGWKIKDKNGREILMTSFGIIQINENSDMSEKMDRLDCGIPSCGLYSTNPNLFDNNFRNLDVIIESNVDLILMNEKMDKYIISNNTSVELDLAIDDMDSESFFNEIKMLEDSNESIKIKPLIIKEGI